MPRKLELFAGFQSPVSSVGWEPSLQFPSRSKAHITYSYTIARGSLTNFVSGKLQHKGRSHAAALEAFQRHLNGNGELVGILVGEGVSKASPHTPHTKSPRGSSWESAKSYSSSGFCGYYGALAIYFLGVGEIGLYNSS